MSPLSHTHTILYVFFSILSINNNSSARVLLTLGYLPVPPLTPGHTIRVPKTLTSKAFPQGHRRGTHLVIVPETLLRYQDLARDTCRPRAPQDYHPRTQNSTW